MESISLASPLLDFYVRLKMHKIREVADDEFWKILEDADLNNPYGNDADTGEGLSRFWQWHFALGEPVRDVVSKYGSCNKYSIDSDFNWEPPSDGSAVVVLDTERGDLVSPSMISDIFNAVRASKENMLVNLQVEEFSSILFTSEEIVAYFNPHEREVLSTIVDSFNSHPNKKD